MIRKAVRFALAQPPHAAQRMEGDDVRQSKRPLDALGHHAGHEEVGVDQAVGYLLAQREADHETAELIHAGQHGFLGDEARRPGRHMHDAHARRAVYDLRAGFRIAPCEHIDRVTEPRQMLCEPGNIDVLAAAVDAADTRQRRSMFADQGDFSHGFTLPEFFGTARDTKQAIYPARVAAGR
jgi:hypothetical protein